MLREESLGELDPVFQLVYPLLHGLEVGDPLMQAVDLGAELLVAALPLDPSRQRAHDREQDDPDHDDAERRDVGNPGRNDIRAHDDRGNRRNRRDWRRCLRNEDHRSSPWPIGPIAARDDCCVSSRSVKSSRSCSCPTSSRMACSSAVISSSWARTLPSPSPESPLSWAAMACPMGPRKTIASAPANPSPSITRAGSVI